MDDITLNIVCAVGAIGMLLLYHLWLLWMVKNRPAATTHGVTRAARSEWMAWIMKNRSNPQQAVLAVQTLRNWMMSSSLMASTAVALSVGLIALMSSRLKDDSGGIMGDVFAWKIIALVVCYMFSCESKILSTVISNNYAAMRYFNHVGFLCGGPPIESQQNQVPVLVSPPHHPAATQNFPLDDLNRSGKGNGEVGASTESVNTSNLPIILDDNVIIEMPVATDRLIVSEEAFVTGLLNRGASFQTLGLRGYYLSFACMVWLFGPYFFLVGSVLLVGILFTLDLSVSTFSRSRKKPDKGRSQWRYELVRRLSLVSQPQPQSPNTSD
ncbi:hypothetical protein BJ742DRAFT_807428 [Cladochytrium replicatum]|nr:hypothetical protein BJ742DRAFT_807428 [Cladochytrium replicatum]